MLFPYAGLENHPDGVSNLNAILNGNWGALAQASNPAQGFTASQAATTVTASGNVFSADDVGATIRYADGSTDTIDSVTGPTEVEVNTSRAVSSQEFELYRLDQTQRDFLLRGLLKVARLDATTHDGKALLIDVTSGKCVPGTANPFDDDGNLYFNGTSAVDDIEDGIVMDTGAAATGTVPAGQVAIWFDGTDLKMRVGTTDSTINGGGGAAFDPDGNFLVGGSTAPADSENGIVMAIGVAPTADVADQISLWVGNQDAIDGEAALVVRTESGKIHTLGDYLDVDGEVLAEGFETSAAAIQVLDVAVGTITSNNLPFPSAANVLMVPAGTVNTVTNVTAGARYTLIATGAVTLTDSATLVCRGGNITLGTNESVECVGLSPTSISVSTKP